MDNIDFAKGLKKRTKKLAVSIILLSKNLPNTPEWNHPEPLKILT